MREYAKKRGWNIALQIKEVGSGAKTRPQREELMKAARRREEDVIIVWQLARWGRLLADLVTALKELANLDIDIYRDCLQGIIDQQLQTNHSSSAAFVLFDGLHKNDLYLTCACARPTEAAWNRFLHLYRRFVTELACRTCSSSNLGHEVADFVLTDLCLPDQQGRPRIGSYDGRVPLRVWLRAIVVHHAYRERQRKCHHFEPLSDLPDVPDPLPVRRLEARLRDWTYREAIIAALHEAIGQLSARECLILRLRYEEGLRGEEVARVIQVSPATISRSLQAAQLKLKEAVVTFLTVKWEGRLRDIRECLINIRENPLYSLLTLLAEAAPV